MPTHEELRRVYDAHAGACFGYLLNLTRSEADTRDLLQSLFCRLARRPELLAGVCDVRAFLLRMAHNAAVDLMRRNEARCRHTEALAADSVGLFAETRDPDEAAFRGKLETALAQLPPEQRAVVHLKLWEGMTFEVIADTLDIPPDTAASRYRYGIDKLRAELRPLYSEIQFPSAAEIARARQDARIAAAYSALLRDPATVAVTAGPETETPRNSSRRRSPDLGRRSTPSASARV